jgi:cytochrome c biogenesis protein CcdA
VPDAPYPLALAAGVLAAVNPCGFVLLPAYLSLLIAGDSGDDPGAGRGRALGRAMVLTAAMTLGFVAVFGVFGALTAPVADALAGRLPWLSIAIGLVLVALGGWLLAGRAVPSFAPRLRRGPAVTRRFWSMVLFGMAFAVASLGCTIGPFLAVVVAAGFGGGSPLAGVGLFLTYAAGMGLVVGSVALAVALARTAFVRALRRATPALTRAGGALLVLAGGYVAWYGWYEIRALRGDAGADPVVDAAGGVQSRIAGWIDAAGAGVVAATFAVLLSVTVAVLFVRSRRTAASGSSGGDTVDFVAPGESARRTGDGGA